MCGRYDRKTDKQKIAEAFHARLVDDSTPAFAFAFVFAVTLALEIEASNPAARRAYRSAPSNAEGHERSPKGEATDSIAFVCHVVFFLVFSPKIACQAQKPPKSFKRKEIELAV
jgi:hypothetical protein